jgi:hypothetical protein
MIFVTQFVLNALLIHRRLPQALLFPLALLGIQPGAVGRGRAARLLARLGLLRRSAQQFDQPLDCFLAIGLLRAVVGGVNDQDAIIGDTAACQIHQARFDGLGQRRRVVDVKTKLHGCGNLIDVLPARAGGAHELEVQFVLVDARAMG